MIPAILVIIFISYLLGSIPNGYLIGKLNGIDIRQHGSGNIGATNVFRTLGKKWGIFVFVLDAFKGFAAVILAKILVQMLSWKLEMDVAGIIAAVGCILGHNYTCWLGFKGGKGVATSAGVIVGLLPQASLVLLAVWALVFYTTRYVSLASIVAAIAFPVAAYFFQQGQWILFSFSLVAALMVIWRHRSNIQRLLNGTENRFVKKK